MVHHFFEPGQLFWAPSLFLNNEHPIPTVSGNYNPQTRNVELTVERVDLSSFSDEHLPIQPLGVRSNERAGIFRLKKRPVILLSAPVDAWRDAGRKSDECYLVVPVYSFQGDEGKVAYSDAFIDRIKGYVYNGFFYLPTFKHPTFGSIKLLEGCARLDRLQMVPRAWLEHMPIRLGDEALECLRAWMAYYAAPDLAKTVCDPTMSVNCMPTVLRFIFEYREQKMKDLGLV